MPVGVKSTLLEAKRMGTSEVLDKLRAIFKEANILELTAMR